MGRSDRSAERKQALIVGASRGLGLALVREYLGRGWHVTATARVPAGTQLHALKEVAGGRLELEVVDINELTQLLALRSRLSTVVDLLFVNAGVTSNPPTLTAGEISTEEYTRVMLTNALSPMRTVEVFGNLVSQAGTIAVMSSGLGSIADNEKGTWEIYACSKAALNQLMRSYAARHKSDGRTLLLVAPGWTQTDMGGPDAPLRAELTIPSLVNTIEANWGRGGLTYLDYTGKTVRW